VSLRRKTSAPSSRRKKAPSTSSSGATPSKGPVIESPDFFIDEYVSQYHLHFKLYFGVSFAAMLRRARELGCISAAQFEDYIKRDPDSREPEELTHGFIRKNPSRSHRNPVRLLLHEMPSQVQG
jgi:hypothetical protein